LTENRELTIQFNCLFELLLMYLGLANLHNNVNCGAIASLGGYSILNRG